MLVAEPLDDVRELIADLDTWSATMAGDAGEHHRGDARHVRRRGDDQADTGGRLRARARADPAGQHPGDAVPVPVGGPDRRGQLRPVRAVRRRDRQAAPAGLPPGLPLRGLQAAPGTPLIQPPILRELSTGGGTWGAGFMALWTHHAARFRHSGGLTSGPPAPPRRPARTVPPAQPDRGRGGRARRPGPPADKYWAVSELTGRGPVRLVGSLLKLHLTRNAGAALPFATGTTWVFTIVATVVAIAILGSPAGSAAAVDAGPGGCWAVRSATPTGCSGRRASPAGTWSTSWNCRTSRS